MYFLVKFVSFFFRVFFIVFFLFLGSFSLHTEPSFFSFWRQSTCNLTGMIFVAYYVR